jgi:hypothetical protein
MSDVGKLIRSDRLLALRLWKRGYLSDEDLLSALETISRLEWPPGQKDPITQELDRQVGEDRNDARRGRRVFL